MNKKKSNSAVKYDSVHALVADAGKPQLPRRICTGYKLVSIGRGGRKYSLWMDGVARVHYVPGKPSTPHKDAGPLAVYTSKWTAQTALSNLCAYARTSQLWECTYVPSRVRDRMFSREYGLQIVNTGDTAMAARVTLVRRIE